MSILTGISSIEELQLRNQRVLVRADLDAPEGADFDTLATLKLRALLPTLERAQGEEARVIVASHQGSASGREQGAPSLERVAARLSELSGWEVLLPDDCLGDAVKRVISDLRAGQICMLENLKFHQGEERNEEAFARALAAWCDVYVNDALGCSHERYASVSALPRLIPVRGCGLLLHKELKALLTLLGAPVRPTLGVLGAAASEAGLELLELLLPRCDKLCVAGTLGLTLLAAAGRSLPSPLLATALLPRCRTLLDKHHETLLLPVDLSIVDAAGRASGHEPVTEIPTGHHRFDIGPATISSFSNAIAQANTIVYTGLMHACLDAPALEGSHAVLRALSEARGYSLLLGNESVLALARAGDGVMQGVNHVSLGGEATLALLAGKKLPGIDALRGASHE